MKKLVHEMSWRDLDVLFLRGGNAALAPILRSKGFPINDNLVPSSGVFYYDDRVSTRIFTWEGEDNVWVAPSQPIEPEEKDSYIKESTRTIELEDD